MAALGERLDKVNERLDRTDERLDRTDEHLDRTDERLDRTDEHLDAVDHHMNVFKDQFVAAANACVEKVESTTREDMDKKIEATGEMRRAIAETGRAAVKEAESDIYRYTTTQLDDPINKLYRKVDEVSELAERLQWEMDRQRSSRRFLSWATPILLFANLVLAAVALIF